MLTKLRFNETHGYIHIHKNQSHILSEKKIKCFYSTDFKLRLEICNLNGPGSTGETYLEI